ncbi:GAF and ANTAR domain-containing protein [Kribbella swartbergensis]
MTDHEMILARLAGLVAAHPEPEHLALRMAEACQVLLGVDGAAITIENTSPRRTTLCATDGVAWRLEDLQEVTGEGPCRDAYRLNEPVVFDLEEGGVDRWPAFTTAALQAVGRHTTYSFPMRAEGRPYGAISMYAARGRQLNESLATAQLVVDAVGAVLLSAPADDLVVSGDLWASRVTVHQATGMIIAQAGVHSVDALAVLRAHAYATDQPLADVAAEVVDRRLDFKDLIDDD